MLESQDIFPRGRFHPHFAWIDRQNTGKAEGGRWAVPLKWEVY